MANRKISFAVDEYYHIYNRGNSKQEIFKEKRDYNRFLDLLYLANGTNSYNVRDIHWADLSNFDRGHQQVSISAYCLMPNHFHILLRPLTESGVSEFMRKLCTSYSMYFNKRYERKGGLFEGVFKSQHVDSHEYLKHLFSYIHLNPVKLVESKWRSEGVNNLEHVYHFLRNYSYFSLPEYLGQTDERARLILDKKLFEDYVNDQQDLMGDMIEWLEGPYQK